MVSWLNNEEVILERWREYFKDVLDSATSTQLNTQEVKKHVTGSLAKKTWGVLLEYCVDGNEEVILGRWRKYFKEVLNSATSTQLNTQQVKKYMTWPLGKIFGERCWSTVLTAADYWPPAELDHDR